jgi:hypothetical protein
MKEAGSPFDPDEEVVSVPGLSRAVAPKAHATPEELQAAIGVSAGPRGRPPRGIARIACREQPRAWRICNAARSPAPRFVAPGGDPALPSPLPKAFLH